MTACDWHSRRAVRRARWCAVAVLLGAPLVLASPGHTKSKPHPAKCRAGYVHRTVRVPKRKHGHIVRVHGKIVYVRVKQCVKVRRPGPTSKPTPPTTPVPPSQLAPPPPFGPITPPAGAPANTASPTISGAPRQGSTLTASDGTWTNNPTSRGYQWQRCDSSGGACRNVSGAAGSTYSPGGTDVNSTLRVSVTARNAAGSAAALSAPTGVIGLSNDPVLATVGDIACPAGDTGNSCQQQQTATLTASQKPDGVVVLGDNQYNSGLFSEYQSAGAYNATWGGFNPIVHPVPGNHEYTASSSAAGYFQYFGAAAHPPGYYSFSLGTWHIVALNSDCSDAGCADALAGATSSTQTSWLQSDLAANQSECVLAYWHHPRFSSGFVGDSPAVGPLWSALYGRHADLVLGGHDHLYERYAQQDPSGAPTANGIREFVVGTGGENLMPITNTEPSLQVSDTRNFGVLVLTLHASSYDWAFKDTNGTVIDSGTTACHGPAGTSGSAGAARDLRERRVAHLSEAQLLFGARPLHASLPAVAHRGLPVAIHCSRACDLTVTAWLRHGSHLERLGSFHETEAQVFKPYSQIFLRLPARPLQGLREARLLLRFTAVDAAGHHRLVTRIASLKQG
jgi:calcineurin-like phosphoesterase family protein